MYRQGKDHSDHHYFFGQFLVDRWKHTQREMDNCSPSSKRNIIGLTKRHIIVPPSRFVHLQISFGEFP